ncbi:MAG: endonuclease V [Ponticaulis sp.]|nr:endonuclease V [Ponticaulis sp.]|tara:strand:- start:4484 stop:5158 length:675 start_codon:yes stop_codon:yes gene_type:complete
MRFSLPENWPSTPDEARDMQVRLAPQIRECPLSVRPRTLAGVDVAYDDATDTVIAAVTMHDAETLAITEKAIASDALAFPYMSGLFSFREIPPVLKALNQLDTLPDILICDGHGRAHPRRIGLASHLGLLVGLPSIGCAKTHLFGKYLPPGETRGDHAPITHEGEIIGAVLRTQTGVNPVYVSVGHLITLSEAIEIILAAAPDYRLPETTRAADQAVRRAMSGR